MIANGNQAIDGIVCSPVMIEPTAARSGGIRATSSPTTEPMTRASAYPTTALLQRGRRSRSSSWPCSS